MKLTDQGMCIVRGLAALVVVFDHSIAIFLARLVGAKNLFGEIASWLATQAVVIFFIISGYLITQSILKNTQRNAGRFDFIEYAAARISRIYPPLFFAITASLLCYFSLRIFSMPGADSVGAQPFGLPNDLYSIRDIYSIKLKDIFNSLFMSNGLLQVDGPLWSLCIEWRIYFVIAFIALALTRKQVIIKFFWLALAAVFFVKLGTTNSYSYFYFLIWMMGSSVALIQASTFRLSTVTRKALLILPAMVVLVMLIGDPALVTRSALSTVQEYAFQIVISLLYLGILFPLREVEATRTRRLLIELGDFSYTLYIVHFPLMLFLLSLTQGVVGYSIGRAIFSAVMAIGAVLAVSYFSAKYFERKDLIKPYVKRFLTWVSLGIRGRGLRKSADRV